MDDDAAGGGEVTRGVHSECQAPSAECGVHLTTCPAIPPALGLELRACLVLINAEAQDQPLPHDPRTSPLPAPARLEALERLARLHWEGMTRPTVLRTLILLGHLMNEYQKAWRPVPGAVIATNPIYRVSIPPIFSN
jgi:hypothetical protein